MEVGTGSRRRRSSSGSAVASRPLEPHKELPSIENYRPDFDADAHTYFNKALDFVTEFYLAEVGAFMSVEFDKMDTG